MKLSHIIRYIMLSAVFTAGILSIVFVMPDWAKAQDIEALKGKIEEREQRIQGLEKEIDKYETELQGISTQADTLENEVQRIRASQNKLETEIDITESRVNTKEYTIEKLQLEIKKIEKKIQEHRETIKDIMQRIDQIDNTSLLEVLLQHETISGFWDQLETLDKLQVQIADKINELRSLREQIVTKQQEEQEAKQELENLQSTLSDKNEILEVSKQENQTLLTQTKSQENEYQRILEEKRRQRDAFLTELNQLESQLEIAIDKSKLPSKGSGVLGHPMKDLSLRSCWDGGGEYANCVTQYFGHTSFSRRTNAYKGNGHNGMDFRASIGEEVYTAESGVVQAIGNTDAIPGCYSYGKWVLVKHNNNLTTLYAHLSLIKVAQGQQVNRGNIIGYAGNTGYSTGPHLHFTVYASEGVRVHRYENSINCKQATIPIADLDAYLDPLPYL